MSYDIFLRKSRKTVIIFQVVVPEELNEKREKEREGEKICKIEFKLHF